MLLLVLIFVPCLTARISIYETEIGNALGLEDNRLLCMDFG